MDTKLATLIGVGSSYLWRFLPLQATAPVIHKEKKLCLGSSYLSNSRFLAPSLQRGFALFAGTAVNDTSSVTATASAWDSLYHTNTLNLQPLSN